MTKINKRLVIHIILASLIVLNLAFIFIQSAIPKETSGEISDKVGDIVGEVIPPETKPGEFIQVNIRKIAHFVEFASLGLFTALFVTHLGVSKKRVFFTLTLSPFIALFDETIQLFSDRGSSVKDVWIDTAGFVFATVLFYTVWHSAKLIFKKVNNSRQNLTE